MINKFRYKRKEPLVKDTTAAVVSPTPAQHASKTLESVVVASHSDQQPEQVAGQPEELAACIRAVVVSGFVVGAWIVDFFIIKICSAQNDIL